MKVSIIIPNWNGEKLIKRYLPYVVEASKVKGNKIGEIIVVDDASTDSSVELIRANFPTVKLICRKTNGGFSSTVNLGVRYAKGELVCLLNTDVRVSKNFLVSALVHFKKTNVFGVSLHETGYGPAGAVFSGGYLDFKPQREGNHAVSTFWASGGSGIFRRDVWMEMKGLDETLFSPFYWEDIDISYRAMKRGFGLIWEPQAKIVHKHESTINSENIEIKKVEIIRQRNELLFIWKNITSNSMFRRHTRGVIGRIVRHPGYLKIVFAALKLRRVAMKARKREKRESIVSDEAIFSRFI